MVTNTEKNVLLQVGVCVTGKKLPCRIKQTVNFGVVFTGERVISQSQYMESFCCSVKPGKLLCDVRLNRKLCFFKESVLLSGKTGEVFFFLLKFA